jgi:hypothetical protein
LFLFLRALRVLRVSIFAAPELDAQNHERAQCAVSLQSPFAHAGTLKWLGAESASLKHEEHEGKSK